MSEFYTQNGWKGENYSINLSTKEITAKIREFVKKVYPDCKFSCRCEYFSMGSAIHITLLEAPQKVFAAGMYEENNGYIQSAEYYIRGSRQNYLTEYGKTLISTVQNFIDSYNRSDSESMIDYFDENFYSHFNIGTWEKPFKVVEKSQPKQNDGENRMEFAAYIK